jgi:hypothetical protein
VPSSTLYSTLKQHDGASEGQSSVVRQTRVVPVPIVFGH